MKTNKLYILTIAMALLCVAMAFYSYDIKQTLDAKVKVAYTEGYNNGTYTKIDKDKTISELKKENKALYDSIKGFKDQVTFLAQFKYKKVYVTDTIYIKEQIVSNKDTIRTFSYSNGKNDSINYKLDIGSITEPNWYKLNITIHDDFTIINKHEHGLNNTTINSGNNGLIEDVTIFNKKRDYWYKRFKYGPQVGFGYGTMKRNFDIYVGFGITYGL